VSATEARNLQPPLSHVILDGGLSYEMADEGGSVIWMAKVRSIRDV
jgi:hypothetical protein